MINQEEHKNIILETNRQIIAFKELSRQLKTATDRMLMVMILFGVLFALMVFVLVLRVIL